MDKSNDKPGSQRLERRLTAILAADVVGYSKLMGEEKEGTLAALKAIRRELTDPRIVGHRGPRGYLAAPLTMKPATRSPQAEQRKRCAQSMTVIVSPWRAT